MSIGVLNEILTPTLTYQRADGFVPTPKIEGDPLQGEQLLIRWQDLLEQPFQLHVALGARAFVSDICLTLGELGGPTAISIFDVTHTHLLCRHEAETDGVIPPKELALTVGEELEAFILEFEGYFAPVDVCSLKIYGATTEESMLFPTPTRVEKTGGTLAATMLKTYTVDGDIAAAAGRILTERIAEVTGILPTEKAEGALCLVTDPTLGENAYRLAINAQGVTLTAADLRGFVYGGENLLKLYAGGAFPCLEIEDAPFMPFRGVHLMLPGPEEMEFARRLIKYVVSPMGYNALILEIAGGMRFESHPEITAAVLEAKEKSRAGIWPKYPHASVGGVGVTEPEDVAAFADYVRSFGIDVIPEVQSLGHVQFMLIAHPELTEREEEERAVEIDELAADVPPKKFYGHSYCPSNERSYEITMDLLDEIIEVVRPTKYVHMGHDEVYQIGVCPKCREKDPADLFAADVCRYHAHLKEKGLSMMIWSDMLQPVTKYRTPPAIAKIPRDVTMLDFIWYFHMDKDIEDNLLPAGFPLAYGNLYSSHFPRFESRIKKPGVIGGQISAWVGTNEHALGKEGKIYDFLFTAEMLWSSSYDSHLRLVYDRALRRKMSTLRLALRGESPLTGVEIALLPRQSIENSTATEVAVNATCAALVFEHAATKKHTRIPWGALEEIGCYRIAYEDGTVLELPLAYGGNIGYLVRRQNEPMKGSYYRHNGYFSTYFTDGLETRTESGAIHTVYRFEWRNPTPDKKICSVTLCNSEQNGTDVRLAYLGAILL